jgi:hypothetical protein
MNRHRVIELLGRPITDTARGLDRCLDRGPRGLAFVVLGLVVGWWFYVPCHELLHAAGCILVGGEVNRLEISAVYGGNVLQGLFPFVVVGEDYAGRLVGFDTRGRDLVYLATDLAPFVLTLFPGVWALRAGGAARRPFLFGLALPVGLAPFVSIPGDAYEIGSILITRLSPWSAGGLPALLRGDDLVQQVARVSAVGGVRAWSGLGLAIALGIAWAFAAYLAGSAIAVGLGAEGLASARPDRDIYRRPEYRVRSAGARPARGERS